MAGEKRSQDKDEVLHATAVLVDIEGTTTSISFVKDVLFPYVRQNLKNYIETKWEDEEFKQDYEKLKEQAKKDSEDKLDGFVAITGDKPEEQKESLLNNILWQMDNDRKTGALKQLQGHMWREAYNTGAVKAHVYDDVPKALEAWTKDAKKLYVYSSGSVEAQKLLFGHSIHGDLLKYFSGYFDTEVGAKQESDSYKNIVKKIGEQSSNVVFLTDIVKEAAAAKEAGLLAVIVEREGNTALTDEEKVRYKTIKSFLDLSFQSSSKRAKLEMTDEKNDETTADSGEPMDTSEDIEMSEVTDKKTEKIDGKNVNEPEKTQCPKSQPSENASTSLAKDEESMAVEKNPPNIEQETPIAEAKEANAKSKDTDGEVAASESAEKIAENNITTKDNDKITKKTEENLNAATTEIPPTTDDAMDVSLSESTSKSENIPTSSEKKTEDSTDIVKDTQKNEVIDKIQTTENSENNEKTDARKDDATEAKAQTCDKTVADKPEECLAAEKDKVKEESKADAKESMDVVAKSEQEEVTKMDTTTDVMENGKPVEATEEEKPTVSPKEMEATTSTTESKKETTTPTETSVEKSSEATAEPEKVAEKTPQAMETEETAASNVEKSENEAAKQEKGKEEETVKENVVDKKDTNTVDSEKQKLNGAAQNGDTDVPVLDDKLHSNGLNEGQSKETTSEDAAAQNGEPESTSETSAETIKVKKVVDTAVVDAAGEPDVVPPVVVATS